jgi:hypothetical protein
MTTTKTLTIAEWLETLKASQYVSLQLTQIPGRIDNGPQDAGDTKWNRGARHFHCRITVGPRDRAVALTKSGDQSYDFQFSQGSGIKQAPKLIDLFDSLRSDASCAGGSFDDFCGDLGYDSDSRRALATYEACSATRAALLRMLGRDQFNALMESEGL